MKKRIARILLSPGFFILFSIILFLASVAYHAWVQYEEDSAAWLHFYWVYFLIMFVWLFPMPFGLIAVFVALKKQCENQRKILNLIAGVLGGVITCMHMVFPVTYCCLVLIILLWIGQKIVDCVTARKRRKQRPQEVYNYYYESF